ncbi:MAG: V-type ATP synthase subunit A [Porticoccus sp.]
MSKGSNSQLSARVVAIQDGLITIESTGSQPLVKNEVIYVIPQSAPEERLKAEVLRVQGKQADAQVFEDTKGLAINDGVEQTGSSLSIKLGPGLLGQVFDGLQNPLENIAGEHGFFLPKGVDLAPLNTEKLWHFEPRCHIGEKVRSGDILGSVQEGSFSHHIMVPFNLEGVLILEWLHAGNHRVTDDVAQLRDLEGNLHSVALQQSWPVRQSLSYKQLQGGSTERLYPTRPLITGQRIVDTFFPIAKGGTACIPGPFGAGKTVLQHLISKHSDVDVVVIVACGERAGEVVETITEFPQLKDPRTGNSLMERTILICNTSSMPVAAREASIYTGITLGEYYQQMGLNVLLLADSTSRWAQAMRETSGRLEEIPGEEAFPAYLDSTIRTLYERSGVIRHEDGRTGSLTLIGTVSPAGGNFDEPVTQSTLRSVKTFLGLSRERAYRRAYPAIDPLISWSRYHNQLERWYEEFLGKEWGKRVAKLQKLMIRGDEIARMMQVTGEEGVSLDDYITYHKAQLLDIVYLQQDAFDPVDASSSLERQKFLQVQVIDAISREYDFPDRESVRKFFTRLSGLLKSVNYEVEGEPSFIRAVSLVGQHIENNVSGIAV